MESYEILKEEGQNRDGNEGENTNLSHSAEEKLSASDNESQGRVCRKERESYLANYDAKVPSISEKDDRQDLEKEKTTSDSLLFGSNNSPLICDDESEEECDDTHTQLLSGKSDKDVKNGHGFVFLPKSAVEFGFGVSSSDSPLEDGTGHGSKLTQNFIALSEDSQLKEVGDESTASLEESSLLFEKENQGFIPEIVRSNIRKSRSDRSDGFSDHSSTKEPSLSLKKNQGIKEKDKVPLLLPSPARTDVSSEEESTMMSTSIELDSLRSPGIASDGEEEDQGVCSKYSQLSEDGSSPSFAMKTDGDHLGLGKDHMVFEHSLELGVAFSEYVDVDDFKLSLGERNPHTEDGFGGKSEEHLLVLLKAGSQKNLKTYLRQCQWPAESDTRHKLWENICMHLLKARGNIYEDLVKDCYGKNHVEEDVQLPAFVDRSHLHHHHLNNDGIDAVKKIMGVIGHFDPYILHCPLLFPLASTFLHYMGPNSCFNCIQALLRSTEPTYIKTNSATDAAVYVLMDLAKKYTKQAYTLIVRSSKTVETVFNNWIFWLFRDLPFQYLVRVVDCFLIEGYKVLYRTALALIFLFTKDMNKKGNRSSPVTNINAAISRYCANITIEPKKLLKVGFRIRGLTRKEIGKLEVKHQNLLITLPGKDECPTINSMTNAAHLGQTQMLSGPVVAQYSGTSILSKEMLQTLWSWIPHRYTLKRLVQLYTSEEHGTSLRTLFVKCEHAEQTILAIKSSEDEIFGAFCSSSWNERHWNSKASASFFGTGETFVFTLSPKETKYPWAGLIPSQKSQFTTDYFMAGDDSRLIIGSGGGEAIELDGMMNHCRTSHCNTFDNDPLNSSGDFSCRVVEVYGFVD